MSLFNNKKQWYNKVYNRVNIDIDNKTRKSE